MKKSTVIPLLTFIVLISISLVSSFFLREEILSSNEEVFESEIAIEAHNISSSVEELLSEQNAILNATRALFDSSDNVTRDEWSLFSNSIGLETNYPSLLALEYVKKIESSQKDEYEDSIIADTLLVEDGYPNFSIHPDSLNKELFVVHYLEPMEENIEAFGYDLSSNESIKKALELARDTNSLIITSPITLIQENEEQKSFLMILPVYQHGNSVNTLESRQEFLEGFVVSVMSANDLFLQALSLNILLNIDAVQVDDITNETKNLLDRKTTQVHRRTSQGVILDSILDDTPVKTAKISIGTKSWLFSFFSNYEAELFGVDKNIPILILGLGAIIATLLSLMLFVSMRLRGQAEEMAIDLTKDLQKFKLAIESISEQIVITDPEGIILYANKAVEIVTGYKREEVIGQKAGKLWGGLMPRDFYQHMWQVIKELKKTYVGELTNKRKNGEEYHSQVTISPIINDKDEIDFFVSAERDITGEKKIDNLKTQFITLASHQLRTPLSAMKWNLEMLKSGDVGDLKPEQRNIVKNVYQSSLRMISLVNSLLNISKVESGKIIIDPKVSDIVTLLKEVISELKKTAEKQGIKIITSFEENIDEMLIDPQLIREAYRNLLTNSVKYSPKGGTITIKLYKSEGSLVSEISDTGIGIPESEHDQVFKKFHRGSNVLTTETDGTGLGLYMTKTIVESSNGKIWFNSTEGVGTTFWFSLPFNAPTKDSQETKIIESDTNVELQTDLGN